MRNKEDLGFYIMIALMGVGAVLMVAMITEAHATEYWFESLPVSDTISPSTSLRSPNTIITEVEVNTNTSAHNRSFKFSQLGVTGSDTHLVALELTPQQYNSIKGDHPKLSGKDLHKRAKELKLGKLIPKKYRGSDTANLHRRN